jgi:magnesium transporter
MVRKQDCLRATESVSSVPEVPQVPPIVSHVNRPSNGVSWRELNQTGIITSALVIDDKGDRTEQAFSKADLLRDIKMQPRDIRIITKFTRNLATILLKDNAILLNIMNIKAIIQSNRVLVFEHNVPNTVTHAFVRELCNQTEIFKSDPTKLPFELRALEAVLLTVTSVLETRFEEIRPAIQQSLDLIIHHPDHDHHDTLEKMLKLRTELSDFQSVVQGIYTELRQLWQSDEDMASMYLTTRSISGHRRLIDQHDEVELLLESYLDQLEQIAGEIQQLQQYMHATDEYLNVHLDSIRNRIMKYNLVLSMGAFSTSISAAGAAVFGMNLQSNLEHHPSAFIIVTSGLVLGNALLLASGLLYGRIKRIW